MAKSNDDGRHKCANCTRQIHARFKLCVECQKNDPYRGWFGIYLSEKRKKTR